MHIRTQLVFDILCHGKNKVQSINCSLQIEFHLCFSSEENSPGSIYNFIILFSSFIYCTDLDLLLNVCWVGLQLSVTMQDSGF